MRHCPIIDPPESRSRELPYCSTQKSLVLETAQSVKEMVFAYIRIVVFEQRSAFPQKNKRGCRFKKLEFRGSYVEACEGERQAEGRICRQGTCGIFQSPFTSSVGRSHLLDGSVFPIFRTIASASY
ncbi:hypothetical protein KC366_g74 [Hortaea werneckii]|nr:hypothetical protein KC366_g74 [Hortaea werneckii]